MLGLVREGKLKRVLGRHKVTCEACKAYGTLVECDTCTSSWHSHCVTVDPVPNPDSPPDYWSCPKCISQAVNKLRKDLMRPLTTQGGDVDSLRMLGKIPLDDDGNGSLERVTTFQQTQQCHLKPSATLRQGAEKSQSTIQVLQEALSAKTSQVERLELDAHLMRGELENVKKERERVAAELLDASTELNQIKAENSESKSRMDDIMKIVEGFFVHRQHV
jgi:hypothetical protein